MNKPKAGEKVIVTPALNEVWAGEGVVDYVIGGTAVLTMTTGSHTGQKGGFTYAHLLPVSSEMKILSIKRSTEKTGLKVYGKVLGEHGLEYNFAYFRRPNFRGWMCSCESFFFTMFKKNRNCKHLRFVRGTVGRFAASVKV